MKLRTSLIALACLASVGAAHAVSPTDVATARANGTLAEVRLSGASALRLLIGAYAQADLAQPGTFDVFFNDATGANHRAYSFKTKVAIGTWPAGTTMLITKRDAGGSAQGVTPLLNGGDNTQTHMLVDGSCVATANPSPATDITKPTYTCAGTTAAYAHAGFSDVEPALLQSSVNGGTGLDTTGLVAGGFVQNIFGVAVNKKLYLALQKAQGLDNAGAIDESAAKQPSLPRSFVAGALTGAILGNNSSKLGWNLVVPETVDANARYKKVNVCRRNQGSGTQAASNLFFANAGCTTTANTYNIQPLGAAGSVSVVGSAAYPLNGSSQLVEGCLGTTAESAAAQNVAGVGLVSDAYALGVLGRENNPLPVDANGQLIQDKGYRFVKLSGVAPTRANVISGDYDFVVESSMQWSPSGNNAITPGSNLETLLLKLRNELGKATILAGLDADLQNGLAATPSTFSGAWVDLDATTKSYTSHTTRKAANSCSFVRMTK